MSKPFSLKTIATIAIILTVDTVAWRASAAEEKEEPIKHVMNTFHKAPKGVDPICKKALEGKASSDELKKLVAAYKTLTKATPPKGDQASWTEKTGKLLAASESLEKGEADGIAKYKEALNCKACHTAHKPD
ncbi:MAG: hypothetical protein U1G07_07410 [Verrucomicrobiota bacterium]